jgi:hypothetical protein
MWQDSVSWRLCSGCAVRPLNFAVKEADMAATPLRPDERALIGRWEKTPHGAVPDEVTKRVQSLVNGLLVKIAGGGWEALYRDPNDERLWELTYPHSSWHGGGPPALLNVTIEYASLKYADVGA